jgi:hypothetical protein
VAVEFSDTFTEATADTELSSHTPDTGSGWTELVNDTTSIIAQADFTNDYAEVTNSEDSKKIIYRADISGGPSTANYSVSFTIVDIAPGADDGMGITGRMADASNMYGVTGSRSNTFKPELWKLVAGTPTQLGTSANKGAAGETWELDMQGTAIRFVQASTEEISVTDSSFSAAGHPGLHWGATFVSTDDVTAGNRCDNFSVDVTAAGGGVVHSMAASGGLAGLGGIAGQGGGLAG